MPSWWNLCKEKEWVYVAESSFLTGLRELCDATIFCLFSMRSSAVWEERYIICVAAFGVKPDIITLASAGGGLPIGAMLAGKAAKLLLPVIMLLPLVVTLHLCRCYIGGSKRNFQACF